METEKISLLCPVYIPPNFATSVVVITTGGSGFSNYAEWQEIDKFPRLLALEWIRELLEVNSIPFPDAFIQTFQLRFATCDN